jgi:hypothetical protein
MQNCVQARLYRIIGTIGVTVGMACVTLLALEVLLRICDFRELREGVSERSLGYRYDAEIGWMPEPNSTSVVTNARAVKVGHNSLGLRDEELVRDGKPVIMFLGDSFVWGLDAEAGERFSDRLKPKFPNYRILAAGVSGYGTDQEYLLLRRLWPQIKPAVVVLVFCSDNDRLDNSSNIRYEGYQKPYFVIGADGQPIVKGQPVPLSRQQYFKDNWLVRNLWLARIAVSVYLKIMHPLLFVPDPTEKLVGLIRTFVEGNGAKFLVAIQRRDEALARYLERSGIPFVSLDGAAAYPGAGIGGHWTPDGQAVVADRVFKLLAENNIVAR